MTGRKFVKGILNCFLRPVISFYLKKPRTYNYKGIHLKIYPGVFHPGFFFSTRTLIRYIKSLEINNKAILELGAGSGLISVYCAKKGAFVTSSDISKVAVQNLYENAKDNDVTLNIIESDLFLNIPPQIFDLIIVNPPYFPRDPVREQDMAWNCGENFEYFEKLFGNIAGYTNTDTEVIMILSEDCDLSKINSVAERNNFSMETVLKKRILWEWNYIFRIAKHA